MKWRQKRWSLVPGHLGKETGNFQSKIGNNSGNLSYSIYKESQSRTGFKEETDKATSRKQELLSEETFAVKINDKSFLTNKSTEDIFDGFFSNAAGLDIDLLPDDKRWLKTVCFGMNRPTLACFLSEYIDRWHNAMEEMVTHKKQSAGRRAANIWLRETLKAHSSTVRFHRVITRVVMTVNFRGNLRCRVTVIHEGFPDLNVQPLG